MSLLPFARARQPKERSLAGFVLGRIEVLFGCDPNGIALIERAEAVPHDVHHAFAKVAGDERWLRVIIAPADAPVTVAGRDAEAFFPMPESAR